MDVIWTPFTFNGPAISSVLVKKSWRSVFLIFLSLYDWFPKPTVFHLKLTL